MADQRRRGEGVREPAGGRPTGPRLVWYRGTWCVAQSTPTGTRRTSLRTRDRAEAERALADLLRKPAGKTAGEIVDAYIADLEAAGKPSAARARESWKALRPTFGALMPDQVTRELCRTYIARRRRDGRAPGTIDTELRMLRAALRWANPRTEAVIESAPRGRPRERHLTREEYRHVLEAAKRPHVRLFITLALATAARKEALLDLTWERVDFARGLIRLDAGGHRQKGRATVPMTDAARKALEEARKGALSEHVIEYAGKPVADIKGGVKAALTRAGIREKGDGAHVFRHTAAVWMAEAGASMAEIAEYLGHTDSRITERVYARFSPTFLRRAAAALEV